MTQPALVGIDLGTTHIKAGAFTLEGRLIARAERPTPTLRLPDGGAEYEPEALYTLTLEVLGEVITHDLEVLGVGVASMAEAGVLVGIDGATRGNALAWFDPRSHTQAAQLLERFGVRPFYARSGVVPSAKHGLSKLLWLRDERGVTLEGATWLHLAEYVAWRLTGERATTPTLAARTLAYDLERKAFDAALLDALELPNTLFPRLEEEGATVGHARGTPFPALEGVAVTIAGHDHPCAALGAGVVQPLEALVSTGTAEAVLGVMDAPRLDGTALERRINQGPLPVPGLCALQAGASMSGGGVEWLRGAVLDASWDELEALLENSTSPTGLLWLPHLAGSGAPSPQPLMRGTLTGFTPGTTRGQLARAALEGSAFELRRMLEGLEDVLDSRFAHITVTGGHTRSRAWTQLKADALGRPLEVLTMPEATLLGAALLGGVAGGVYTDALQASSRVQRGTRTLEPTESADRLEPWFQKYLRLHATMLEFSETT